MQNTPCSDHFWKLRCRKSARRCGAKQISKSKCTKHRRFGALLEVAMSKKCTPLRCEEHVEVKSAKNCITTTHISYSVLSLKLPPPACAVLLVCSHISKPSLQILGCFIIFSFSPSAPLLSKLFSFLDPFHCSVPNHTEPDNS